MSPVSFVPGEHCMSDSYSESRRPRKSYWLWLVILLLLAAGVYWFIGKDSTPEPQGGGSFFGGGAMSSMPVPVKVATAEIGSIDYTLKAIGTVSAFNTVTVRSRVDGELQKIAF